MLHCLSRGNGALLRLGRTEDSSRELSALYIKPLDCDIEARCEVSASSSLDCLLLLALMHACKLGWQVVFHLLDSFEQWHLNEPVCWTSHTEDCATLILNNDCLRRKKSELAKEPEGSS